MIRNTPFKLLRKLKRYRLLTFNAKWIDRVDEINRTIFGKLANHVHARVEVALNLQHLRAVVQRLGQLCMTHLTTGNDDRARQLRARSISRQTRRCVSSARAGDEPRAEFARLRHGHSHARVFERSGRIATLVLEFQMREAAVISGTRRFVERRVSFTKRHDFHIFRKRQELSKTPNTTAIANIERRLSLAPKLAQRSSIDSRVSRDNVEQSTATRTHVKPLVDFVFGLTIRRDATLYK